MQRKLLWLAVAVVAGCLVLVLLLLPPTSPPRPPDLRIIGQPQMSNGAILISIVLSNGNSGPLNIMDDVGSNAFVGFDNGSGACHQIKNIANSGKLNLAPGACLTNIVQLTNPPPQFQLLVVAHDFAWIRRRAPIEILKFWTAKATHTPPTPPNHILWARSPWFVTANVSNTTRNATTLGGTLSESLLLPGRLMEPPTNGFNQ